MQNSSFIDADLFKQIAEKNGFELVNHGAEVLEEISGQAWVLKHVESGARLLFLENDDNNKAFSIAFKTPPANSTGVFHILEHSVLCGSKKYPVKEPFVNLLKSSMQTFLNAMTFPDKTVYPVASTNEQDLLNLTNVYLDAVFNPRIFSTKDIFLQEGWHRVVDEAGREKISGVVYNEMKGALSEPDSVLFDALCARLYPETAYEFESGGEPKCIPNLSYEEFLETHRRHYSPQNAYICLYGNLGRVALDKFLGVIGNDYLTPAAKDSEGEKKPNALQTTSVAKAEVYDVEMDIKPENAVFAKAFKIGTFADLIESQMISVLMEVLLSTNVSPLKKRLLETGVASEFYTSTIEPVAEPAVIIACQGVNSADALEVTERIVGEQMQEIACGKFDKSLIEAQIDRAEFELREHNFGTADGVVYSLVSLSCWLYDENKPTDALKFEAIFKRLREMLTNGELESLVKRVFIDNTQVARVRVLPKSAEDSEVEAPKLSEAKAREINAEVARLQEVQQAPDSPEDVKKLPYMSVSDVDKRAARFDIEVSQEKSGALTLIDNLQLNTHGINYFNVYLDFSELSKDDLPYFSIMASLLGKFDTDKFSAEAIDFERKRRLGRLSFSPAVTFNLKTRETKLMLKIGASCLYGKEAAASELAESILTLTRFDNLKRVKQILMQQKIMFDQDLIGSGHTFATRRASSKVSPANYLVEQMSGIAYKQFLDGVCEDLDQKVPGIISRVEAIYSKVLQPRRVIFGYCATDAARKIWLAETVDKVASADAGVSDSASASKNCVSWVDDEIAKFSRSGASAKEAFAVKSDVTFAAIRNNLNALKKTGETTALQGTFEFDSAWPLVSRVLSFDYLWNTIRVQGGAYGCGFSAKQTGGCGFYTYRDPNVKTSIETCQRAGEWLETFAPDSREMEGYVVSTVAGIDQPLKPSAIMARNESRFFAGLCEDDRESLRTAVLEQKVPGIKNLAGQVAQIANDSPICVIGNLEAIKKSEMFDEIVEL